MGYLNQYTRRRVAAILLAVLVIGGVGFLVYEVAGLGPPTPEEEAEEATREFFVAGAAGDYEKACSMMTGTTRETLERQFALLVAQEKIEGCSAILEVAAKEALADGELQVIEISVTGPEEEQRARVEIKRRIEGEGRLQRTVLLQEVGDGRWKISDPGFE